MPCYRPIKAWKAPGGAGGKARIVFSANDGYAECELPCGRCIGCRLERSRQWAMRCMHEASLYENNCFLTLTYDDEHLPVNGSLDKSHFQGFMKRLRARFSDTVIRYYHCGEYGERLRRPHYHACLFNFDFPDKKYLKMSGQNRLYTSDLCDTVWSFGHCFLGDVTFESAGYCARYIMKKVLGDNAHAHYTVVDGETGEMYELQPEYTTMSRRPGIGRGWFERFSSEVFPDDMVIVRGRRMKPPRFYDTILEVSDPAEYRRLKDERILAARKDWRNSTPERLRVRACVKGAQIGRLKRGIEDEV